MGFLSKAAKVVKYAKYIPGVGQYAQAASWAVELAGSSKSKKSKGPPNQNWGQYSSFEEYYAAIQQQQQSQAQNRESDLVKAGLAQVDAAKLETNHYLIQGTQSLPNLIQYDFFFVKTIYGNVTLTLPPVEQNIGKMANFKKLDAAGSLFVKTSNGLIDGSSSITITTQYEGRLLYCTGDNWWIV